MVNEENNGEALGQLNIESQDMNKESDSVDQAKKKTEVASDDVMLGIPTFSVDESSSSDDDKNPQDDLRQNSTAIIPGATSGAVDVTGGDTLMDVAVMQISMTGLLDLPVVRQIEIKKQLNQSLSNCMSDQNCGEKVVLDSDDGLVIAFMQKAEDALKVALQLRDVITELHYEDYFGLKPHIGISFGDVMLAQQDGQLTLLGKTAEEALYLMRLSGVNQLIISSAYYVELESVNKELSASFRYCGIQVDKYGEGHEVYEFDEEFKNARSVQAELKVTPKIVLSQTVAKNQAVTTSAVEVHDEHSALMKDATSLLTESSALKKPDDAASKTIDEEVELTAEVALPIEQNADVDMSHLPSADKASDFAKQEAQQWDNAAGAKELSLEGGGKKVTRPLSMELGSVSSRSEGSKEIQYRKPLPTKEIFLGLMGLIVVAVLLAPFVMPLNDYAAKVAQAVSARIGQPVQAEDMQVKLLPLPHLLVSNIAVGSQSEIKVQSAQLHFDYRELLSSTVPLTRVVLSDVQVKGDALPQVADWFAKVGRDSTYPIRELELERADLLASAVSVSKVSGRVRFNADGTFESSKLATEDSLYQLELLPQANKMILKLVVHDGSLPLLKNWQFSDLTINGELLNGELMIPLYEGYIKGGKVKGNARLVWSEGWQLYGNILAEMVTAQDLNRVLTGNVDGKAQFKMFASDLKSLAKDAEMSGSFIVRKGALLGVDVADTIRERRKMSLPGGRTYFDSLSGSFSAREDAYSFSGIKMDADLLTATGSVNVVGQQIRGRLAANLRVPRTGANATLVASGLLNQPVLSASY